MRAVHVYRCDRCSDTKTIVDDTGLNGNAKLTDAPASVPCGTRGCRGTCWPVGPISTVRL